MVVLLPYLLITSGGYSGRGRGRGAAAAVDRDGARLARRGPARRTRSGARVLLGAGPVVAAIGFVLFLRVDAGPVDYVAELLPALALIACGLTLSVAPLTAAVMGGRRRSPCRLGLGRQQRDRAHRRPARDRVARLRARRRCLGAGVHRPLPRRGDRRRAADARRRRRRFLLVGRDDTSKRPSPR